MSDCIVVGGGVSGMLAAITIAKRGLNVTILEKNDCLGKKILVTGNGRCNFTNEAVDASHYMSTNEGADEFIGSVLKQFDNDDFIRTMGEMGMSHYVREGYYYPKTDEAATFRDALINELIRLGIEVVYNFNLRSIDKSDEGFTLSDKKHIYHSNKVVLAMGGNAAPGTGSSGDAYYYLKKLGHTIIKPLPALTTLKAEYPSELQGVNALADITILIDDRPIRSEHGFVKFYKGMLSGIPIYQLSCEAVSSLYGKCDVKFVIDLTSCTNIRTALNVPGMTIRQAFCGSINPKIVDVILDENSIAGDELVSDTGPDRINAIYQLFSSVSYEIIDSGDWTKAQTTSGGVDISEIDANTMESRVCPNLYLTGEIMDVTGRCGGYNIQWAASTGVIAGSNV